MLNIQTKYQYPIRVFYRLILSFVIGYLNATYLALNLTLFLHYYCSFKHAEAIFLAAFISIISFIIFVIYSFIIPSLTQLTLLSLIALSLLYSLSHFLG